MTPLDEPTGRTAPARRTLDGAVAIVTGGSRGIGRAVVELFATHGASVVNFDLDVPEVSTSSPAERRERLPDPIDEAIGFVRCDVSVEADVRTGVAETIERFGPPLILVNNAGVNANFDATEMTVEQWERFFGVDLKASWLTAKHVLPHMKGAGRGSIVNVSSIHGFASLEGFFPYGAAKSGLLGLTRNLALDYGRYGIRVNTVAPGFTRTRLVQESIDRNADPVAAEAAMTDAVALGRIADPIEVAHVVRFLASDEASYVTGASLVVDGGLTARRAG